MEAQTRVHKLLILVGDQGQDLDARDFKKLSEVIVGEYLSENNPTFKSYLTDILVKVVRGVPLKQHFYAALTAFISRQNIELSNKILDNILQSLETDLSFARFGQALNTLNFLAQAMNISFFNSLTLMNLLEDILIVVERQSDGGIRKGLIQVLVRALPLLTYSLSAKISHEFKRFIEKVHRLADGDQLAEYIYSQFTNNKMINYSAMERLQADFTGLIQFQSKFKLHLDFKAVRQRDTPLVEYYKWEHQDIDEQYEIFSKTEGAVNKSAIESLIEAFFKNGEILKLKITNFIKAKTEQQALKHLVETLVLRGLKSKNGIVEYSLLLALKGNTITNYAGKILEDILHELFLHSQNFQLSVLISYSKMFSFLLSNWRESFDWERYLKEEQQFSKRNALLKLIFEKLTILNDKFVCPPILAAYEPNKPVVSEEEYSSTADLEAFEQFEAAIKSKTEAGSLIEKIDSQKKYEIFLEALFRRTSLSQTHLTVLQARYHDILVRFGEWDWDLINKVRNFFKNSFFHRLLYLRLLMQQKALAYSSYVNYVGQLKGKSEIEMIFIKMELNQLNSQFGKTLRQKQ